MKVSTVPSQYYTAMRIQAQQAWVLYTGSLEDLLFSPVMFLLLIVTMMLEGFWQVVERFVDLSVDVDTEDVSVEGGVDLWEKVFEVEDNE